MVELTADQVFDMSKRVLSGELTAEALRGMFVSLASGRFPQLSEEIRAGVVPTDYFAPYRAQITRLTGIPEQQVDFTDPKWSPILSTNVDGKVRPMTLDEATRHIRKTDDFQNTSQARAEAAGFANTFLTAMGAR